MAENVAETSAAAIYQPRCESSLAGRWHAAHPLDDDVDLGGVRLGPGSGPVFRE